MNDNLSAPDLSVIVPCRDVGIYLREAVDSVRREFQASSLIGEVIVVDDRSRDPVTLELLRELSDTPAVRVISNCGPVGPGAARNTGIKAACGAWIAFLDGDDMWLPGALEAHWRVIRAQSDAAWIGTDYALWYPSGSSSWVHGWCPDEKGRVNEVLRRPHKSRPWLANGATTQGYVRLTKPLPVFIKHETAWTGTVFVRKELLEAVGGFDERLRVGEDTHLWIRLASRADYFFVPHVTALYRQRAGSLMNSGPDPRANNRGWIGIFLRLLHDKAIPHFSAELRNRLAFLYLENTYAYRGSGDFARAAQAALCAIRYKPRLSVAWRNLIGSLLRRA